MSQTFTSTLHLSSSSVAATSPPITLCIWAQTTGGQNKRMLALAAAGDNTNVLQLGLDTSSGASNDVSALHLFGPSGGNQALSTAPIDTSGAWSHMTAVFASNSSRTAYMNGANKGNSSSTQTNPSGINQTLISGRADFAAGIFGQAAHAAVWIRALSDTEVSYLGVGGNPRQIKGVTSYWKIATVSGTPASPVPDEVGSNTLTASGSLGAGTTDPNLQTYMTNGPVGNLSYTAGTAITPINVSGLYDSVSSAYTVTLAQLGSPTSVTSTSGALTATREIVVGSSSAFGAGDYLKVTSGGTPTRVLAVNGTTILVATDQTYANSALVYRFAVNPLGIAGLAISGGNFSGTPTAAATYSFCFFRATCTGNTALVADSDVVTITITGGGGGGGGGLQMPAGAFCGGMVGG